MRNGQNKRMRGRNRSKGQNPMTRVYESNGPDVKVRGTASHVAEKYLQLARDAQTSGDPVGAENYFQHAEHYFRLIASMQDQFRPSTPYYRSDAEPRDEIYGDGEEDSGENRSGANDAPYAPREPHAQREPHGYSNREAQPYGLREPQPPLRDAQPFTPRQNNAQPAPSEQPADVERLPNFITGSSQPAQAQPGPSQNGHDGASDRYSSHRRRRRRHPPRGEAGTGSPGPGEADTSAAETPPAGE